MLQVTTHLQLPQHPFQREALDALAAEGAVHLSPLGSLQLQLGSLLQQRLHRGALCLGQCLQALLLGKVGVLLGGVQSGPLLQEGMLLAGRAERLGCCCGGRANLHQSAQGAWQGGLRTRWCAGLPAAGRAGQSLGSACVSGAHLHLPVTGVGVKLQQMQHRGSGGQRAGLPAALGERVAGRAQGLLPLFWCKLGAGASHFKCKQGCLTLQWSHLSCMSAPPIWQVQ